MFKLLLQKYGIIPVQDVGQWLVLFTLNYIAAYIREQEDLDELERQYIADARAGLSQHPGAT